MSSSIKQNLNTLIKENLLQNCWIRLALAVADKLTGVLYNTVKHLKRRYKYIKKIT